MLPSNPSSDNTNRGASSDAARVSDGGSAGPLDGLTRRKFLGAVGVGAAISSLPSLVRPSAAHGATRRVAAPPANGASTRVTAPSAQRAALNGDGILVLVTLYGGSDGLNMVVPASDPAYQSARRGLAWAPEQVLALREGFGLNPAMTSLHGLFGQGQLAVVHGVGYPSPNRSHFRSMDIWQSAVPDAFEISGWLGRWHDLLGPDPLRMVHVGPSVPRALAGRKGSASALPGGQLNVPVALEKGVVEQARPNTELGPWGARVAATTSDLLRTRDTYGPIIAGSKESTGSASLEGGGAAAGDVLNPLDEQLAVVSKLIAAGTPARVFSVSLGGFDTHAQERDQHSRLLAAVDGALGRFQAGLASMAKGPDVVTLVYSEFGRRVAVNLSDGTDHGTAAPVLVLGSRVRGGFHGAPPSLTDLDNGDLRFTTDFRSVYGAVLGSVLGTDAAAVIPKAPSALTGLF